MTRESPLLFSAVIPAYNCSRYVGRAIASVLAQKGVSVECIVVDDGSTDDTATVVAQRFGPRVRLVRQPNGGAAAARNAGIAAARGSHIAFLDADDYWLDTKLQAQARVLASHPGLPLISTLWRWLPSTAGPDTTDFGGPPPDDAAVEILPGWPTLLRDPYLCTPSVVVDAQAARACGGFDTTLPSAEDVDFFLRVCAGRPYARINARLVGCQLRPDSLTKTERSHAHNLAVLEKIAQVHPEVQREFATALRDARLEIYANWTRGCIFVGRGRRAREVLRESRGAGQLPGYGRLWAKSYFAPWIRALRDRWRPHAREEQALR